jgi:hypothetical protein
MISLKAVADPMLMRARRQEMTVVTPIDQRGTEVREST